MILICGVLADAMTELMCARLDDLGYEYLFLDQAHFPGRYDLTWELGPDGVRGHIACSHCTVDLADLTGVYARYVSFKGGPERPEFSDLEKQMADAEYQLSLMQLLEVLPCTVVNRAAASVSNDSKIYQGFLAERFGLLTPRTLATTDPEAARAFYAEQGGDVIYKSLSGVRSIVHRLTDEDLGERLERVRNCPTQFQERVEGVDIRVHTVGDQVFPTEIHSEASDYRYARREGKGITLTETEIPDAVAQSCLGMARALGLHLSGVDLRRTPEGCYYCFEVNPSPGFIFYESNTGQPISAAVAHLLRGVPEHMNDR
jgi:glutathione synthase/RimK-type ligase-like ATP-grasp enzyme